MKNYDLEKIKDVYYSIAQSVLIYNPCDKTAVRCSADSLKEVQKLLEEYITDRKGWSKEGVH